MFRMICRYIMGAPRCPRPPALHERTTVRDRLP
jgi:hypothetical protein